jgi:hypothetical protein
MRVFCALGNQNPAVAVANHPDRDMQTLLIG